jgi:hypothetical protein
MAPKANATAARVVGSAGIGKVERHFPGSEPEHRRQIR